MPYLAERPEGSRFQRLISGTVRVGILHAYIPGRPRLVWYERATQLGTNETLLVKGRSKHESRENSILSAFVFLGGREPSPFFHTKCRFIRTIPFSPSDRVENSAGNFFLAKAIAGDCEICVPVVEKQPLLEKVIE